MGRAVQKYNGTIAISLWRQRRFRRKRDGRRSRGRGYTKSRSSRYPSPETRAKGSSLL